MTTRVERTPQEQLQWLTVSETARRLLISESLVRRMLAAGDLAPMRRFGRLVRVHVSALDAHAAAQ
jgi:excisionase family DNA binding protein